MVENNGDCVLRWTHHAGCIMEKFSELFARQVLVDVTLVCEEQKLRVHKLVLASNSAYFEEILMQDLGLEPVIFLKDLNFEILKAMVEFMYCGETTISWQSISSLSIAAKIFKVKELENVINSKMKLREAQRDPSGSSSKTHSSIEHKDPTIDDTLHEVNAKQLSETSLLTFYSELEGSLKISCQNNVDEHDLIDSNELKTNSIQQIALPCNDINVFKEIGKRVKVYKKRKSKSLDSMRNKSVELNYTISDSLSTNNIDLSNDSSDNKTSVTLSLEMESTKYMLNLSYENIYSSLENESPTVRYVEYQPPSTDVYNEDVSNIQKKDLKEDYSSSEHSDSEKPTLRRSVRLNQQENEDPTYNNVSLRNIPKVIEKSRRHDCSHMMDKLWLKGKRQIKASPCGLSRRPTEIMKKNNNHSKEKEQKPKSNKNKYGALDNDVRDEPKIVTKLNTVACISRALWGDMSDIFEDTDCKIDLSEFISNRQIPFAVGLLPLRTALERMQATPDYQPRKTRSSVVPIKHYGIPSGKRKYYDLNETIGNKKLTNDNHESTNTVCHIQIRTAPSSFSRNRKKFITGDLTNLQTSTLTGAP